MKTSSVGTGSATPGLILATKSHPNSIKTLDPIIIGMGSACHSKLVPFIIASALIMPTTTRTSSNWNKILCNLPSSYLSKNMKYRSLISPLSKLNAIEIREAGCGNSEAALHYGLYCAFCKQFITNSDGFIASISKLVDLLQNFVDVLWDILYCHGENCGPKQQLFISANLHLSVF